jgi:uncharacterized iron-regulated membrane protein
VTVASASAPNNTGTNNTGLIVGLVVGLFFFLLLLVLLIILIVYLKKKSAIAAAAAAAKPVGRSAVAGQAPGNSVLQSRVSTRNPRAVRLAPLPSNASQLPAAPVASVVSPTSKASAMPAPLLRPRAPARGIPLRLDPIRYSRVTFSSNEPMNHDRRLFPRSPTNF